MWWIIIIALVVFMVIKFASDSNKQANAVAKQGGMRKKYKTLVDYMLSGHAQSRIIQETATSISVGVTGPSGSTVFFICQTFGSVTIQYKVKNVMFGNHQLEWSFDEFMSQEKMIEKISHDIEAYYKNVIQNFK